MASQFNFTKHSKKKPKTHLSQTIQKSQEKGRIPGSFDEASIILISKPHKGTAKKEN